MKASFLLLQSKSVHIFSFCILFCILNFGIILNLKAQVTITVGTQNTGDYNSSTQYPTAYSKFHGSTHQQFLLTALELQNAGMPAGNITALGFRVYATNSCGDLANYTIKLKQTTASSITTFDNTGLTQVYTTYSYTPSSGWNTHTFSTQFTWNGYSNILVDLCNAISPNPPTNVNASTYYTGQSGYYSYVLGSSETVSQCGSTSASNYGQVRPTVQFTILPNTPSCAVISSPANNADLLPRNTTLSWTSGGNTSSYDVYFGTNPNPPFVINKTSTSHNPGILSGNTDYYWKIIAKNSYGSAIGCSTWHFRTNSGLVSCISNPFPSDNSINVAYQPNLSWTASIGATYYKIYLGTTPNPPLIDSTTSTNYTANTVLLPDQSYYWKIAPKGSYEYNDTCGVRQFTTWSGCVSNQSPIDGSTNLVSYPILSWSAVPTTISYYIYLGTSPNPPLIDSTSSTTYNAIDLIPNTLYYWKVIPRNSSGFAVSCPTISFTTKNCNHWFVKTNGNDGSSGNSWNNAKQDLSIVMLNALAGDSIHVAAGTYYPTRDSLNNILPSDQRTLTFTLKPGIKLIGGYPSTANGADLQSSLLISNNPLTNQTILNGDIGASMDSTDNSYHVITVCSGFGGSSLIDGFTIKKGRASLSSNLCSSNQTKGGGIYMNGGKLNLYNSLISDNFTVNSYNPSCDDYGGGIYSENSVLTIFNCVFLNNKSNFDGSAIYTKGGSLKFYNSSIVNMLYPVSDAIHTTSNTTVHINNSTSWNKSIGSGAGDDLNTGGGNILITNSTFSRIANSSSSILNINNSIIGYNSSSMSNTFIKYSFVYGYYYDGNSVGTSGIAYPDSWLDTLNYYGGTTPTKRLKFINGGNPAAGRGNPAYAGQTDQRGVIRNNTPCPGAYEVPYAKASDIIINDTVICPGTNITLKVSSTTIQNPVFKWYSNASLSTLLFTGNAYTTPILNSSLYYYVVVYNDMVYANPIPFAKKVTVMVTSSININQQPLSETACVGNVAVFSVAASGAGLSYQWKKNNVNLQGDTNSKLILNNISLADSGNYSCKITNICGTEIVSNQAHLFVNYPVQIITQPQSSSICENVSKILYISSDSNAVSYQWQKNGINLSGLTNDTLFINNAALSDSGVYRCRVTGLCGDTIYSQSVLLTVIRNVSIEQSPSDMIKCLGQNIILNVNALGSNLAYQWYKNGNILSGQNNDTLFINNAVLTDSGNYICNVSGTCGAAVLSQSANLIVSPDVIIQQSPSALTKCVGENALYKVIASGANLSYQWQKNGIDISNQTNDTLLIYNVALSDSGIYSCKVFSLCGGPLTSQLAALNVIPNISIVQSPYGITKCINENTLFSVIVTGSNPGYQWQKNGIDILGQTNDTLLLNNIALSDSGNYRCIVTGSCGGPLSSQVAKLSVLPNVSILQSPANDTKCVGGNKVFKVQAIGLNLTYQWLKNGVNLNAQHNDSLMINNIAISDTGAYTCNVTGLCGGTVTSQAAYLTVISIPANSGNISGLTSVCQGQNAVTYIVPAIAYATSYIWTLPNGVTGSSITDSIILNYGTSAVSGNITVKAQNACGVGTISSLPIVVNPLPTAINANAASLHEDFQNGMPSTFTIYNDNYTVNSNIANLFPNGWNVIIDPDNATNSAAASTSWFTVVAQANRWMITSSIIPVSTSQLTWKAKSQDSSFLESYSVKISTTGVNKTDFATTLYSISGESKNWTTHTISLASYAGQSIYIAFIQHSTDKFILLLDDIDITPIYNPSVITGFFNICSGSGNYQYSVNSLQNATSYIWTFPTGISGSSITNNISLNFASNAQSGNITVRGQNSCGIGDAVIKAITVITSPPTPIITQNVNTLISNANNGNQWYDLATGIINSATASTYTPQQTGDYFTIVNVNGCNSDSSNIIHFDYIGINENNITSDGFFIYPNPAKDMLMIELQNHKNLENTSVSIYNIQGKLLLQQAIENPQTAINIEKFAKGVYTVKLMNDKKILQRKFVKE